MTPQPLDPSFEEPVASGLWQTFNGGSIGPWTVASGAVAGGVDLVTSQHIPAADGTQSVDLNAGAQGSISQDVSLAPGTYSLGFALAGNPDPTCGPLGLKYMNVAVDGTNVGSFTFDTTGHVLGSNPGWVMKSVAFSATQATTNIAFVSTTPGTCAGPMVDEVSITAIVDDCSVLGPSCRAWAGYYDDPASTRAKEAFCAAGGATTVIDAHGVPACQPAGNRTVDLPTCAGDCEGSASNWVADASTVGFQCVELAERYLFVNYRWPALAAMNGDQLVDRYAEAGYGLRVENGGGLPRVGDLMSLSQDSQFHHGWYWLNADDAGHVAVVVKVTTTGGKGHVYLVGQNSTPPDVDLTMTRQSGNNWTVNPGSTWKFAKWLHVAAQLRYTGPASAAKGAPVRLSALLTVANAPAMDTVPIVGRSLRFTLDNSSYEAITDATGLAVVLVLAPAKNGSYPVDVTFSGDQPFGYTPVGIRETLKVK